MSRIGTKKPNKPNIYLVGFMGAGKSTLGPLLAEKLGMSYLDSDAEIERRFKMKVSDIFFMHGEKSFRRAESRIIQEVAKKSGHVISLGGGALLDSKNRKRVCSSGKVVYLSASLSILRARLVRARGGRPLLSQGTTGARGVTLRDLRELLEKRRLGYEATADFRVSTSGKKPQSVAVTLSRTLLQVLK